VGVRVFYLDIGRDTSITTDSNVLTGGVVITEEKGDRPTGVTTRRKKFRVSYLKDYDYNSAFGIK